MIKIGNPIPLFVDARGALLDGGFISIGTAGGDPDLSPVTVYWDAACTIPAQQPLRTMGGFIVNGATPANVFSTVTDYSLRVKDSDGSLVFYAASAFNDLSGLQPKDADLTAIAAQGTTPFGLSLLLLANQAALQAAVGLPAALPLAGGTMTGNITRQGAGVAPYFADPAITGGRIFITAAGAADPTSQPGDLWFTY